MIFQTALWLFFALTAAAAHFTCAHAIRTGLAHARAIRFELAVLA